MKGLDSIGYIHACVYERAACIHMVHYISSLSVFLRRYLRLS